MNDKGIKRCVALVLAGDRTTHDPVAVDAGVVCKAITPVNGIPMIMRVINALESSGVISSIILCGLPETAFAECPELNERISKTNILRVPGRDTPSRSAEAGLAEVEEIEPVLITTADHALLTAEIVSHFVRHSLDSGADATFGLVEHGLLKYKLPEVKRTVIKLRDGNFCGCNLFSLLSSRGRTVVPYWRRVEESRKHPGRMVAELLGIFGVLSYLAGFLTLKHVENRISAQLKIKLNSIILPFPEAGIDVDTPGDRRLVEKILANSSGRR